MVSNQNGFNERTFGTESCIFQVRSLILRNLGRFWAGMDRASFSLDSESLGVDEAGAPEGES
jgi:hypothetical protein